MLCSRNICTTCIVILILNASCLNSELTEPQSTFLSFITNQKLSPTEGPSWYSELAQAAKGLINSPGKQDQLRETKNRIKSCLTESQQLSKESKEISTKLHNFLLSFDDETMDKISKRIKTIQSSYPLHEQITRLGRIEIKSKKANELLKEYLAKLNKQNEQQQEYDRSASQLPERYNKAKGTPEELVKEIERDLQEDSSILSLLEEKIGKIGSTVLQDFMMKANKGGSEGEETKETPQQVQVAEPEGEKKNGNLVLILILVLCAALVIVAIIWL